MISAIPFLRNLIIVISVLSKDGCSQQKWGCGLDWKKAINRKNITMFSNRCSLCLKAWVYQIIERSICNIMPQWGIEKKKKPSGIFMKYSMYLELTTKWARNLKDVLLKLKNCVVICLGHCHKHLFLRMLPYSWVQITKHSFYLF